MAAPPVTASNETLYSISTPFLLDDPMVFLEVLEGRIDVFVIPAGLGVHGGPRRHLWSVERGGTLMGFDLTAEDLSIALVGVTVGGTRVRRVPVAAAKAALQEDNPGAFADRLLAAVSQGNADAARTLLASSATGTRGNETVELIEEFLTGIASAVTGHARPVFEVLVAPNRVEGLEKGQRATAAGAPVWLTLEEGSLQFVGDEAVTIDVGSGIFPIPRGVWLRAGEESRFVSADTVSALEDGEAPWAGLDRFRALFLRWVEHRIASLDIEDAERLQRKAASDNRMRTKGLVGLAGVLGGEMPREATSTQDSELFNALDVLGRHAAIPFKPAPRWETENRGADPLAAICRASRVAYRQVGLRGEWWRQDAGPLLAFTDKVQDPRILLPRRSGGYDLENPATGERISVDADVASKLEPLAFAFYRPAPEKALERKDLLTLAFAGLKKEIWAIVLIALAGSLLGLLVPIAQDYMFDSVIPNAQFSDAMILVAALAAVHIGQALFEISRAFVILRVEGKAHGGLQATFVDRLLGLPVPFFREYTVGDLADRVGAVNALRDLGSGAMVNSILGGVASVVYLLLLLYYSWKLALLAVIIVVVAGAFTVYWGSLTIRIQREVQNLEGKISGLVFQLIAGISKLRVSGSEGRGFTKWSELFQKQKAQAMRAGYRENVMEVFNTVLPIISTGLLFYFVGRADEPLLDTSKFIAFNSAFGTFFRAGVNLSNSFVLLLVAVPIFERARPILRTPLETTTARPDPGELSGRIEVAHLTFRYSDDGPTVLDNVSFGAQPGEFIALVGPSGSGKSTILRLLLGFERPETGGIYYDGQDLAGLDITAVRAQLGVVLQTSRLAAGSIFDNIVGTSPLTMDEAWEAAERAGMTDDILGMPMGMHTVLSEGASTLSGGQRQRLLIARALVRKPRILLFDEATSALDNRTQDTVSRSLEGTHATRIVIAHRLSTIRNADKIYVLDRGHVVEQGSFDELLHAKGIFERLVRRQVI